MTSSSRLAVSRSQCRSVLCLLVVITLAYAAPGTHALASGLLGVYYTATVTDYDGATLAMYEDAEINTSPDPNGDVVFYDRLRGEAADTVFGSFVSDSFFVYGITSEQRLDFHVGPQRFGIRVADFDYQPAARLWQRINAEAGATVSLTDQVTFDSPGETGPGSLLMFWEIDGRNTVSSTNLLENYPVNYWTSASINAQALLTVEDRLGTQTIFDESASFVQGFGQTDQYENIVYDPQIYVGSVSFDWGEPMEMTLAFQTFVDIVVSSLDGSSRRFVVDADQHFGDTASLKRIELRNSAGDVVSNFTADSQANIDYVYFSNPVPEPTALGTTVLATFALLTCTRRRR